MQSDENVRIGESVLKDMSPEVSAWLKDMLRMVMFWSNMTLAHFVQLIVLKFGWWSAGLVSILDKIEEISVLISFVVFIFGTMIRYFWSTYKRVREELR
jgi:hypothetical protein